MLWRVTQHRFEVADAEARQCPLYPVDNACALADEIFPLAAGPLCVLRRERGDRRHTAMIWLAAQPAEKGALEQLGVQAIGLCPPDGDARRMDDVSLDPPARSQRANQKPSRPAS